MTRFALKAGVFLWVVSVNVMLTDSIPVVLWLGVAGGALVALCSLLVDDFMK